MDFEKLSEELKEKARTCETPEELLALAQEEGVELSDEDIEGISGRSWDCETFNRETFNRKRRIRDVHC